LLDRGDGQCSDLLFHRFGGVGIHFHPSGGRGRRSRCGLVGRPRGNFNLTPDETLQIDRRKARSTEILFRLQLIFRALSGRGDSLRLRRRGLRIRCRVGQLERRLVRSRRETPCQHHRIVRRRGWRRSGVLRMGRSYQQKHGSRTPGNGPHQSSSSLGSSGLPASQRTLHAWGEPMCC
jgi:hypothetical protein